MSNEKSDILSNSIVRVVISLRITGEILPIRELSKVVEISAEIAETREGNYRRLETQEDGTEGFSRIATGNSQPRSRERCGRL